METDLIVLREGVTSILIDLHYSKRTIEHYENAWNKLEKFMADHSISKFSQPVAEWCLTELYHIGWLESSAGFSEPARSARRAYVVLTDFQKYGMVYRRNNSVEYEFKECYRPVADEFIDSLQESMVPRTINGLRCKVRDFLLFLYHQNCTDLSKITKGLLLEYLETRKGLATTTRAHDIYVLRRFLTYLYEREVVAVDFAVFLPHVKVNAQGHIPSFYSPDELNAVLSAVDRSSSLGKRDYAIMLFAVRYGMRTGEIKNLQLQSFDWNNSTFSFFQSKTGDPVCNPLLPEVASAVIDYLKNGRPDTDSNMLFVRHMAPYEGFLETTSLQHIVTKYMNRAGIYDMRNRKHGLHSMRHSIAGNLLDQGVPLPTISEFLGHVKTETTTIYTKITLQQLSQCALEV